MANPVVSPFGPEDLEKGLKEQRRSWGNGRPDSFARPESVRSPTMNNFSTRLSMDKNNPGPAGNWNTSSPWSVEGPPRSKFSELPDTSIKPAIKERSKGHRRVQTPVRTGATSVRRLQSPPSVPPSVHFDTPVSGEKSIRSVDVIQAASSLPWHPTETDPSTRSLLSGSRERSHLPPSAFAQQVFAAGRSSLLYGFGGQKRAKSQNHDVYHDEKRTKNQNNDVLDLTTLQRMSQYMLQRKLIEQVKAINENGAWMEIGVRETLHQYCETVRDLELMESRAQSKTEDDPFLLTTRNVLQAQLLEDAGLADDGLDFRPVGLASTHFSSTKRPASASSSWIRRLFMAFTGGFALVAPFIIMLFFAGTLARIITTAGFMVILSIALATGSELAPDRVACITAVYAGLLVIFVGTNPPSYFSNA